MESKLEEFRREMLDEIRNESAINASDPTSEFLDYYADKMISAEEILEFEEYDIEVIGKNRKKSRIDGFCYDNLEKSISLFIADFGNEDTMQTLNNSMIEVCQSRVLNYLEYVYSGFITENCEESSMACQLASKIMEVDENTSKIRIYIFSDSSLSKFVKDVSVDDFYSKKVDVHIWDINRIYNLVCSSLRKEDLNINISEFSDKGIPCIKAIDDAKYSSYLAVINGKLLSDIYIKYGPRLLEGNVRSFLSVRGKINKGIRNTIRTDPEIFFVYNNGIACTATDAVIELKQNMLVIKELTNFQIINGGQTTASIANAVLQDKASEHVKKINVPMKLTVLKTDSFEKEDSISQYEKGYYTELSDDEKKDRFINGLTSNIAKYANSQNKVDESDFFSNHPYHVRFEELSRKVYAPPKNNEAYQTIWFYERAKGQYIQEQMKLSNAEKNRFLKLYPKKQMIKKIDLAKFVMTYKQKPHIVSKGNQYNMKFFADLIEREWANERGKLKFNQYYYKKCISLAILFRKCETLVSNTAWYKEIKAYRANIVTYSIALLFYLIEQQEYGFELNFLRIWNEQSLYSELEHQLEILSYDVFLFITAKERATLNVTEWCKKEACWENAKKQEWILEKFFVDTLIEQSLNDEEMRIEKKEQKENDGIDKQTKVVQLGDIYWKRALEWGSQMKVLSETDKSFLKTACDFNKYIPTDKQCTRVLDILTKLIEEGFV